MLIEQCACHRWEIGVSCVWGGGRVLNSIPGVPRGHSFPGLVKGAEGTDSSKLCQLSLG